MHIVCDIPHTQYVDICCRCLCRCLLAGDKYDLQVVFRLFQLWFTLGADRDVNAQMAEAFRDTPSYKMLSLVYQGASRLSAAKSGPHHDSGFQVGLLQLLLQPWLLPLQVASEP